jgi:hypothetical protein
MRIQSRMTEGKIALALFACGVAGCFEGAADPAPIDLDPPTLEAAQQSLQQLDELHATDPDAAMIGLRQLRTRLDELNGLLARAELAPEHVIDFYDAQVDGIVIAERAPTPEQRVLRNEDFVEGSTIELYRRLTSEAPPPALVEAEARRKAARALPADGNVLTLSNESASPGELDRGPQPGAGLSSTRQALLSTDGIFWRDNVCYRGGDFLACLPNRTGHAFASADAKTSFTELAPYRGVVGYHRSFNGSLRQIWTLFAGDWWWFYQETVGFTRVNHRWDVVDSDGDGFHWTYSFRWNCNSFDCTFRP